MAFRTNGFGAFVALADGFVGVALETGDRVERAAVCQPGFDPGVLAGGVVAAGQMHFGLIGNVRLDVPRVRSY